MFKPTALFYTDGYKVGHKRMLAKGTKCLYGTWIPRSTKYAPGGITKILSFGQQLMVRWLHDEYKENFFDMPKSVALKFGEDMSKYLGLPYDASHFEALHDLGYLPVRIKSLSEGIETPTNVPHMTFINTVDDFGWLTLYLETIISSLAWKPTTSATIALQYRRNLAKWVMKTDPANAWLIPYMAHDFSARGLSPWDMLSSGLGHASSFRGSDSIIVIPGARYFYDEPENEVCINSVNASEHSVSTTQIFTVGEEKMLDIWLDEFPEGILSVVMDTFDLTKVVKPGEGGILFALKEKILARKGKLVIRPDSGNPVEIICGYDRERTKKDVDTEDRSFYPDFYQKGLIECLWEIFGGTINDQGYKVLNPVIGAIYGDSINLDRQIAIYEGLEAKGFATTNIVLGVGSYTYQATTRDTLGWAAKGSWFVVETEEDGQPVRKSYDIYKDPATDDGTKKSLKGLIMVDENLEVHTQCTPEQEATGLLHTIYENGVFYNKTTLTDVRAKIDALVNN